MFGAKGLLKSVATAATNKYIIFHAKPQMFAIQVFHWQHWFRIISWKTRHQEFQDTGLLQPAAVMPTAQKANINVISGGWEKGGAVCNDCLVQSVNRHIRRYYCSTESGADGRGQMWCCKYVSALYHSPVLVTALTFYCNTPDNLSLPIFLVVLMMLLFSCKRQ